MIYNTTEQDSAEGVTEYREKPTWVETLDAATKNFTSVSLSTSASNYYYEERDATVDKWLKEDPANEATYNAIKGTSKQDIEKLEALYEDGRYDAIRKYNGQHTRRQHTKEGQATVGTAFLNFKDLQKTNGFEDPTEIRTRAEQKSYDDFVASNEVLQASDHFSAQLVGTAWGALQDPVTLMTLPLGTWKTGATILGTAGRAFLEEAAIETAAQSLIVPEAYAYKKQIGVKTTLKDEAYNAVMAIGTAGLVRGTASAAFDLTSNGIKALRAKDPELATDYENLVKHNATESVDEHIDNLHVHEFSEEGITRIDKPNAKGEELNNADTIPMEDDMLIEAAVNYGKKADIETLDRSIVQRYIGAEEASKIEVEAEFDAALKGVEGDYEGIAIRGMNDESGELAKLQVGDTYETRGVTSLAKDKETADTFANMGKGEKIYVEFDSFINKPVNLGTGNKLGFEDMMSGKKSDYTFIEDEAVIPSGRNFEIVSKTEKDGATFLKVKEVEPIQAKDPVFFSGIDEAGEPIYRSHSELKEEIDLEEAYINKAKDCIL